MIDVLRVAYVRFVWWRAYPSVPPGWVPRWTQLGPEACRGSLRVLAVTRYRPPTTVIFIRKSGGRERCFEGNSSIRAALLFWEAARSKTA